MHFLRRRCEDRPNPDGNGGPGSAAKRVHAAFRLQIHSARRGPKTIGVGKTREDAPCHKIHSQIFVQLKDRGQQDKKNQEEDD